MALSYTDEMLKDALAKARDLRLQAIDELELEHEYSASFKKKMNKLIKAESKSYYSLINTQWKRIAAIIIVVLIIGITTVVSVPALRTGLYEMIQDLYEKYSEISFRKVSDVPIEVGPFVEYELSYIPEGFELIERHVHESSHFVSVFYKKDDSLLSFQQMLVGDSRFTINTENVELTTIYLNGMEKYYFDNKGFRMIFWNDNQYVFAIAGEIEKDLIIILAQSVMPKK